MIDPQGQIWLDALRAHADRCRRQTPIMEFSTLSAGDKIKVDILFHEIRDWLTEGLPFFKRNRTLGRALHELDPDPAVVFSSDLVGVSCIARMMRAPPPWLVWLVDGELASFLGEHPDEGYRHHIHYRSVIRTVTDEPDAEAFRQTHPIPEGSQYWVHEVETMFAPRGGRGIKHLWSWDGSAEALLKEGYSDVTY